VAPKLVYVVVQKKTRCRLAFSRNGSSDIDNVPPGTIVDSNITEAQPQHRSAGGHEHDSAFRHEHHFA